jgi:hypothetical protein
LNGSKGFPLREALLISIISTGEIGSNDIQIKSKTRLIYKTFIFFLLSFCGKKKVTKKSRQKIQPAGFVVAHTRPARAQIQPVRTFFGLTTRR